MRITKDFIFVWSCAMVLIAMATGFAWWHHREQWRISQEDAIHKAVLRTVASKSDQSRKMIYFVRIEGEDPSFGLMACLKGIATCRPGSEYKDGTGLLVNVDKIKWVDDSHVEVPCSVCDGPLLCNVSSSMFILQWNNGTWLPRVTNSSKD